VSFPVLEKAPPHFRVGDLVGHKGHDQLAGIILDMEYAHFKTTSSPDQVGKRAGTWKAWIQWNGNEAARDFVEVEYLIKLM
jgi:hypothetical protein